MRHPIAQSAGHWIVGVLVAATGIVLARIVAPHLATAPRAWVAAAGQLIALLGIVITAYGVKRRVMRGADAHGEVTAAGSPADRDSA